MKIVISIGDCNGVGLEILLANHKRVSKLCTPLYCAEEDLLKEAARKLKVKYPKSLKCIAPNAKIPPIKPAKICAESGAYSYESFLTALDWTLQGKTKALVTLPIHKKAWQLAGIPYAGHTEAMRALLKPQQNPAIMVLGSPKLYVALFTDHIPLKCVAQSIDAQSLKNFLLSLAPHITKAPCGVLGLNPHAGDFGVLGDEEEAITQAIKEANDALKQRLFVGPLVPDTAFVGKHLRYYVAMYHDQGLIPLKTLYFKESINLTLNLPIIRTSVDHGTAFDIAYQHKADSTSYLNAVREAVFRVKIQEGKTIKK